MGYFDSWNDWRDSLLDTLEPLANALGFEDETVYSFAMGVTRLISDVDMPPQTQFSTEILKATIKGTPISQALNSIYLTGAKSTIKSYMRYGETTTGTLPYIYGLPSMGFKSPPIHEDTIVSIATSVLVAKDLTPLYTGISNVNVKVPTDYDWGLGYLQSIENYTYYMTIGGFNYTYIGTVESPFRAKLVRYTAPGTPIYEYIVLPDQDDTPYQMYYQYDTSVVDSTSKSFRYIYLFPFNYSGPNGEYPELLDSPTGDYGTDDATKMLPIGVIKKKGVYAKEGQDWYASTKRLLSKINLDLDDIVESFEKDSDGNPNESMAQVTDGFFICAVNPYSTRESVWKYLFLYFESMWDIMAKQSYELYLGTSQEDLDSTTHLIKITEGNYNVSISFNYIRKEYITGSIGSVGSFTRIFDIQPDTVVDVGYVSKTYNNSSLIFRNQYSETEYTQITIHGLKLLSQIVALDDTKYGKISKLVDPNTTDSELVTNIETFLIPLSYMFLEQYNHTNVENIIYESFNFVLFASSQTDVEWFESQSFIAFAQFTIQLALLYVSFGAGLIAGTLTAQQIWTNLLIQLVLREAFTKFLEVNDLNDYQQALVLITYIAVAGSIGGTFNTEVSFVDKLLFTVSSTSDIVAIYSDVESEKLADELSEIEKTNAAYAAYYKNLQDGLDEESEIASLFVNIKEKVRYEEPSDYFGRTLNTSTTEISRNYSSNFISGMLDLDKLNQ